MRIIHTRMKCFSEDYAFKHKFTLLVWILSCLKWKEFGNELVLYCDDSTLENIKKFQFDDLYDEIDTSLFKKKSVMQGYDLYYFWAIIKLIALRYEKLTLGNDCVISDQDIVPMRDISRLWRNSDIAVWSNKEYLEFKQIYPDLRDLSLPYGVDLPDWFTGEAKPLNTGIIHIKDENIVDLYTTEAFRIAKNNRNEKKNSNVITMCNCEQRLLGEVIKYKNLTYSVMQPINQGLFNKNGFHTHGYKNKLAQESPEVNLLWNLNLLLLIKKCNQQTFEKIISNDWFKEEKNYFDINGYQCEKVLELSQY